MNLMNLQTATVIQELQFRAYLIKQDQPQGNSLLASNSNNNNNHLQPVKTCSWPDLFQVSVNQNVVHLDRSKSGHKAVDIFQFCQYGDNVLDIQVNDCYCVSFQPPPSSPSEIIIERDLLTPSNSPSYPSTHNRRTSLFSRLWIGQP